MKRFNNKGYLVVATFVLVAFLIAACAPAAAPPPAAQAPAAQATAAPAEPTAAPAAPTAAPAEPTAPPAAASGGTVNIAFYQEPNTLVSYYSNQTFAFWAELIYNRGFWTFDDKSAPSLELASEYPTVENGGISADGLTITYKLKPDLKWSDGEPLTSKDVVFTWEAIMNDKNTGVTSRDGYDKIESVTAPDDTTVVVKFKELYVPWPGLFNGPNTGFGFLPQHVLGDKETLDGDDFLRAPIGAGPFKVTEWKGGDHITFVPNENYWRGLPKLEGVNIKVVPSRDAGNAGLAAGDVDLVADEIEASIPDLDALMPAAHAQSVPSQSFEHYFFNLDDGTNGAPGNPIFRDVNVRKAYIMCIDRQTIADKLLFGKSKVISNLWPNSTYDNTDLVPYPYDPAAANKLLDDAGFKVGDDGIRTMDVDGKTVRFSFNHETTTGNQLRADVQVLATSTLRECGFEMLPQNYPSGTLFGSYAQSGPLATGKYETGGYTTSFSPDPDPGDTFKCDGIPTADAPNGNNWYRLCDPELSKLTEDQAKEADPAKRTAMIKEMQKIMYDKAYNAPLYNRLNTIGVSSRLQGISQSPTQTDAYWNIYDWFVTQ
ncbi:MAG: peptide ABC transporter substrate-binding protein [Anaerolineae bacterium]|nr:peptide ABC transporter substrate-binding protein [Anaerolineae bacterium]